MNNIIIGFSAANSIIAKMIRWISRSEVNHSFIRFYDCCLEKNFVMDASWYGFRIIPYEKFLKTTKVVYEFKSKVDLSEGVKWSAEFLTNEYDWLTSIWLVVSKFFKNPFRSLKKWNCVEAVIRVLQYSGLAEELDPERLWPKDLLKYIKSSDNFEKI